MDTLGKPSREQMEEYYKTSRKYFDELAENYKESDPDYYRKIIVPIKRGRRFNDGGYDEVTAKRGLILTAFASLAILGVAMGVFFILSSSSVEENPIDEYYQQQESQQNTNTRSPLRETRSPVKTENTSQDPSLDGETEGMSNFEKGMFYYDQGAYNRALEYFGQVKPDDENYDIAQKHISEINNMPEDERSGEVNADEIKRNPDAK